MHTAEAIQSGGIENADLHAFAGDAVAALTHAARKHLGNLAFRINDESRSPVQAEQRY